MKRIAIVLTCIALPALAADNVAGRWRGTSICTKVEGNQYCHDETVQYDFTPSKNGMSLDAQKLVNGEYVSMGVMEFTWNESAHRWESKFHTRRDDRDAMWTFAVKGDQLIGTCVLLPDTLVRNAQAKRVSP